MIKKARDIQLGDGIAGHIVRIKKIRGGEWIGESSITLQFLDGRGPLELPTDTDVWVDDPAPCCKPTEDKLASELGVGDVLCLPVYGKSTENNRCHIFVGTNQSVFLNTTDHVRVLKEAPIEP